MQDACGLAAKSTKGEKNAGLSPCKLLVPNNQSSCSSITPQKNFCKSIELNQLRYVKEVHSPT
jgi:hypothetical protein